MNTSMITQVNTEVLTTGLVIPSAGEINLYQQWHRYRFIHSIEASTNDKVQVHSI